MTVVSAPDKSRGMWRCEVDTDAPLEGRVFFPHLLQKEGGETYRFVASEAL